MFCAVCVSTRKDFLREIQDECLKSRFKLSFSLIDHNRVCETRDLNRICCTLIPVCFGRWILMSPIFTLCRRIQSNFFARKKTKVAEQQMEIKAAEKQMMIKYCIRGKIALVIRIKAFSSRRQSSSYKQIQQDHGREVRVNAATRNKHIFSRHRSFQDSQRHLTRKPLNCHPHNIGRT